MRSYFEQGFIVLKEFKGYLMDLLLIGVRIKNSQGGCLQVLFSRIHNASFGV